MNKRRGVRGLDRDRTDTNFQMLSPTACKTKDLCLVWLNLYTYSPT
jgi:hypothetical protein